MSEFKTFYTIYCPDLSGDVTVTDLTYETMEAASAAAARLAEKSMLTVFVCRAMQQFETEVKVKLSTGK
jgi:hypothetical protein